MRYLILFLLSSTLFASPALDRLIEGNKRFISGNLEHPHRDQERRDMTAYAQKPFAIILACADSRLSPEIIFDQGIGDLFVVRVAGNVVGSLTKESIDYAALALQTEILVILGHEGCGAIEAVMKDNTSLIPTTAILIDPAVQKYRDNLGMATKQNALNMNALLQRTASLGEVIREGKLEVVSAYYNLSTGEVEILK